MHGQIIEAGGGGPAEHLELIAALSLVEVMSMRPNDRYLGRGI